MAGEPFKFLERREATCYGFLHETLMKFSEKLGAATFSQRRPAFASLFFAAAIAMAGGVIPLIEPVLAPAIAEARFGRGGSFGFRGSRSFSGSSFGRSRSFGRSTYSRGYRGGGFGLPFLMGFGFGGFGGSFLIPMVLFFVLRMMIRRR